MRPRASAQAIPRGTDKPKPAVDQRKSPRPIALARLRHDGFGPVGRPVSRKGGLPSGRVPRLLDAPCGCTQAFWHRAAHAAFRIGLTSPNRIDSIRSSKWLDLLASSTVMWGRLYTLSSVRDQWWTLSLFCASSCFFCLLATYILSQLHHKQRTEYHRASLETVIAPATTMHSRHKKLQPLRIYITTLS